MNTIDIDIPQQAQQFASLVQQGIDAWTQAGQLLLDLLKEDPDAKRKICEQFPDLTEEILARFEAIGRKQLHPRTLLNNSPGMRRLRGLPYSDQERLLEHPVELLVRKNDGGVDTLNVAVKNLTSSQAMQVFSSGGVRTLEAQRAWIESRPRRHRPKTPYQVRGTRVVFVEDCELGIRELTDIIAQLAG